MRFIFVVKITFLICITCFSMVTNVATPQTSPIFFEYYIATRNTLKIPDFAPFIDSARDIIDIFLDKAAGNESNNIYIIKELPHHKREKKRHECKYTKQIEK